MNDNSRFTGIKSRSTSSTSVWPRRIASFPTIPTGYENIVNTKLLSVNQAVPNTLEALVGTQPLIEDFKRLHQTTIDVKKVQAEVWEMEMENIRREAQLRGDDLSAPDIDADYVFEGAGVVHFGTPTIADSDSA